MPTTYLPELTSAADRLLLDEAMPLLRGTVVVIDAPEVAARVDGFVDGVRILFDSATSAGAFDGSTFAGATADGLAGADVVLTRLPKSLDRLDDLAKQVARYAKPTVTLVAGGRLKYLTRAMNEVLGRSFGKVRASLARQKSRVLFASEPLPVDPPSPKRIHVNDLDLDVVAWGGVFAGASVDIGTRAMLSTFDSLPSFDIAIDFGCGTGILAAQLKRARPSARIVASDDSAIAASSARETFAANGLDVAVHHEAYLESQADASVDLVVLNPPFHDGGPVSLDVARRMFRAAADKLRPGGELRVVWNSHLGYRPLLERAIGPTTELTRTPKFTVTASTKPVN